MATMRGDYATIGPQMPRNSKGGEVFWALSLTMPLIPCASAQTAEVAGPDFLDGKGTSNCVLKVVASAPRVGPKT